LLSQDSSAARAAAIRLLVLDVDGVLTDGRLYSLPTVRHSNFHVRDGDRHRSSCAQAGIQVASFPDATRRLLARACRNWA